MKRSVIESIAGIDRLVFPYLSARGRLVIKDIVIPGGAIITAGESAQLYLSRKKQ